MRVVFLGTPKFAVPSLRALVHSPYEVSAVFTQPDRPSGRGYQPHAPPVKVYAQMEGIPVFQPDDIRNESVRPILVQSLPDFIVVVAYGQILPGWLLQSARLAPVNIHASLLPRYRGAAPVAWAILNGDRVTGVTTMLMDERLDAGAILMQCEVPIPETITTGELSDNLAQVGAEMLLPTLEGFRTKKLTPVPQDEQQVTRAPRITKEMAVISWDRPAAEIANRIRALNPWPLASSEYGGQKVKLLRGFPEANPPDASGFYGEFLGTAGEGIRVQCGEATVLVIQELLLPGRRPVSGREFASGARLQGRMPLFA